MTVGATTMESSHPASQPNPDPASDHASHPDGSAAAPKPGPDGTGPIFTPEDRQLIERCIEGHRESWDAFVERFLGLFAFVVDRTAVLRGMTISSADHDDLVADILLEILHHDAAVLRSFEGRSSLATYLSVIARRVAVRGLMRLAERTPGHRGGTAGASAHGPAHGDDGQARLIDREQVTALIGELDEMEATLVRLHHLEARSYGEISRLTGIPMGSIGPALTRAREKMKLHAKP